MVASDPAALALAARSTARDGICTCAGIVFQPETPIALLEMYTKITTFRTGRPHARRTIPRVLSLIAEGTLRPELVTDRVLGWNQAPDALERITAASWSSAVPAAKAAGRARPNRARGNDRKRASPGPLAIRELRASIAAASVPPAPPPKGRPSRPVGHLGVSPGRAPTFGSGAA